MWTHVCAYLIGLWGICCLPLTLVGQEASSRYILDKLDEAVQAYTVEGQDKVLCQVEVGTLILDSTGYLMVKLSGDKQYEIQAFTDPDQVGTVRLRIIRISADDEEMLELQDLSAGPVSRLLFVPSFNESQDYRIEIMGSEYSDRRNGGMYGFILISEQI